jgi:hypothetical protein
MGQGSAAAIAHKKRKTLVESSFCDQLPALAADLYSKILLL